MPTTKLKIVKISEQLFHENGIANTRLQQIADGTDISVGNLAYHFKNKDAIVEAVYENLFTELTKILGQYIIHRELDGFDKLFGAMYNFYNDNNFTFNNQWEILRNYPAIQQEWLSATNKISLQLKKRIEYNVQTGFFKAEIIKGSYESLAQTLSLMIHCWIPQQLLRNKVATEALYKKAMWGVLLPILTEKGKRVFEQISV